MPAEIALFILSAPTPPDPWIDGGPEGGERGSFVLDEDLLPLAADLRQHGDDDGGEGEREERGGDRTLQEDHGIAAIADHGAAEMVFEQGAEHEAEQQR